jgi:hypothetical protein
VKSALRQRWWVGTTRGTPLTRHSDDSGWRREALTCARPSALNPA